VKKDETRFYVKYYVISATILTRRRRSPYGTVNGIIFRINNRSNGQTRVHTLLTAGVINSLYVLTPRRATTTGNPKIRRRCYVSLCPVRSRRIRRPVRGCVNNKSDLRGQRFIYRERLKRDFDQTSWCNEGLCITVRD